MAAKPPKVSASRTRRAVPPVPVPVPVPVPDPVAVALRQLFPEVRDAKQLAFLQAYLQCGTKIRAYAEVGIWAATDFLWRRDDPVYKAAITHCDALLAYQFEEILRDRVLHGVEREIWWNGERVGTEMRHSDRLLLKALESWMPERYGRKQTLAHELSPSMQALVDQWEAPTPQRALAATTVPPWHEDEDEDEGGDDDEDDEGSEEDAAC